MFPMRPVTGRALRTVDQVDQLIVQMRSCAWVVQPKLNGDRACLAVVNKRVYIQNRHGGWLSHTVTNAKDFLKLPSGTALDGEVYKGEFHPFELLALGGKSYLFATVDVREIMAERMCTLLGHPWLFPRPTRKWLMELSDNAPMYEGVVMKKAGAGSNYILLGNATQTSLTWLKKRWV